MKILRLIAALMEFVLPVIMAAKYGLVAGLLMVLGFVSMAIDIVTKEYIERGNARKKHEASRL